MDIFKTFATDEKLEIEGRWVDFDGETSFKIARYPNKHFSKLFSKEYKAHKRALESKSADSEAVAEKIMVEVMAKTILLDWKGPVKMNDKDLGDYTVEKGIQVLKIKEFQAWVQEQANDTDAFKIHQESLDEKN